jgi:nucleotide-binding universal stress UspA family protein
MSASYDPEVAAPDTDVPGFGDGPSFRRIFVPVRSPGESAEALATAARVWSSTINGVRLVHVRVYDPPMPRCPGPFYTETVADARALLDEALLIVWGGGAQATTAVVDAPRGAVAAAIARQASAWRADVIVLSRRRRPAISRMVLGSVADEVMRKASCPVLTVHPKHDDAPATALTRWAESIHMGTSRRATPGVYPNPPARTGCGAAVIKASVTGHRCLGRRCSCGRRGWSR